MVEDILDTNFGDANLDGLFNTADFVAVLTAGKYEDGIPDNAGWADGDWDGDGDFNTNDLVIALQTGAYERAPEARSVAAVAADPIRQDSEESGVQLTWGTQAVMNLRSVASEPTTQLRQHIRWGRRPENAPQIPQRVAEHRAEVVNRRARLFQDTDEWRERAYEAWLDDLVPAASPESPGTDVVFAENTNRRS